MRKNKEEPKKGRYWRFFIYPDSAPENWRQILEESLLPIAVSPLHDKDLNDDGTPKKPHYHAIVCYKGPQTENAFNAAFTIPLNSPPGRKGDTVVGAYRYFWHMDHPDKFQYPDGGQICLNGFSILNYKEFSTSEKETLKNEIEDIIFEKKYTELVSLVGYLRKMCLSDHLYIVRTNTIYFNSLIRSYKYNEEEETRTNRDFILSLTYDLFENGGVDDSTMNKLEELYIKYKEDKI